MSKRSQFVTRTGVIAATVGSAVGLGNIWRFPYEAGMHGGGMFLIIYLACVFVVGIPVMLSEFVVGRGTHKNALGAMRSLAPKSWFRYVPYLGIMASLMILSFYSVVAGWIMEYLYQSVVEMFSVATGVGYAERFAAFTANPWRSVIWTLIFLVINLLVVMRGLEKGIEKVSNIFMPLLFLLLLVFVVNSLMLPKAQEGFMFLFKPDWSQFSASTVISAMGQAFFSLSLGLTCMMTYASYFSDKTPLVKSATTIAVLDTLVALLAGLMIFPAVFSFGMEPTAGPTLVFETLPSIFAQMRGGAFLSVAFFLLLFVASLTSTISMSEISISFFVEERKMSRRGATLLNGAIAIVFGSLCALSFGVLGNFTIFGMTIFDLFDYVSSNILLPIGGVVFTVFVGWVLDKKFVDSQLKLPGQGPLGTPLKNMLRFCIRFVAPIAVLIIFIYGLL